MTANPPPLKSTAGRWIIAGMVLGSAATFLNATVVNIALPSIGEEFDADLAGLQWVVNGYLLTLSALVLIGGSAGDIFGRRRVFLGGLSIFAAASVACALAPSLSLLVAARLVQGLGAALMTPASLAIVDASFSPDERTQAVGSWASGSALAAASGPFFGGWLVDNADWRWVFALSLPLAAGSAWATIRHVPESRDETPGRVLDLEGASLGALMIAGTVYALVQGPNDGWSDPLVLMALGLGVVSTMGFARREQRTPDPMLPFRLFSSTQFSGANLVTLVTYFAIGGSFFFLAIQLQTVVGYSALAAGAATMPMNVLLIAGSPLAGKLSGDYGPRWFLTLGPAIAGVGMLLFARIDQDASYLIDVLPGVMVMGVGLTTMVAPLTSTVMGAVADTDVGVASAVNNAIARIGGLLATALLPVLAGISGAIGGEEFSDGFGRAMLIAAVASIGAGVIGYTTADVCVATHTTQQASISAGCTQRSLPAPEHAAA